MQTHFRLAGVALLVASAYGCDGATRPLPCTVEISGYCWTELGPAGQWVESVAEVGGTYFAGTRDGLLRFDSDEWRWTRVAFSGKYVTSITAVPPIGRLWVTLAPHGTDTITAVAYASDDGGRTWQPRDGGLSAGAEYHGLAISFAFDAGDPRRLFMGLSGQVVRSVDGGATWAYVYGGPVDRGVGVNAIALGPAGSPRGWAGGQDAIGRAFVLRTGDRGANWQRLSPSPALEDAVLAVLGDPRDDGRCFAGTFGAIRVTGDGGASWPPLLVTSRPGWVTGIAFVDSLLLAIADEAVEGSPTAASGLGLYVSTTRGVTWDTLPVPAAAVGGRALAVAPDGALLIATRAGVWRRLAQ